jgi:GYF domain 2
MANYIIIGGDQKEYGPISTDDVRQWIAEGRLNEQSLMKAESDAEFRPLEKFPEFAVNFASKTPASDMPPLLDAPRPDDPNWQVEVTTRVPELKLGECLAAGWSFLATNAGFLVGAVVLTWLVNLVFVFISLAVPLLGPIIYLCVSGVIMGGFYLACLRRMRGETVSPTEVFAGFKIAFVQLLLTGLVSALLTEVSICFCILPALYLAIAWVFALPLAADKKLFFWSAMELSRKVVTRVWFEVFALVIVAFLPMVVFQVFNMIQTGSFVLNLYDQANHNWQQLAQDIPNHTGELRDLTVKMTLAGQAALLVTLFYSVGVLMRAYENLFGPRKP